MTSLGQAFVDVRAQVNQARVTDDIRQGLVSPISKGGAEAEKSIRTHVAGMSGAFRSLGPALAGTFVGAAVGAGVGSFFRTGLSEVKDYQAGLAQARQVILTTGGAAGVSAGHVETLAAAIEHYSGQTDDSIVKSENLLLTFTNIRNSAGKNNDIFDQATKLTADMAKVFGGDASASAIQLGKALNDPTKGITALTRVGVSFSAGQKATIKSLQDSGNVAGAQKVILAELQKEVGGSAAAYGKTLPGQLDRAKRAFEGVAQTVLTAMLPVLTRTLSFVTTTVLPAFGRLSDFLQKNVGPALAHVGAFITAHVLPAFQKAAAFIGGQAAAAFKFIGDKIAENRPQLEGLVHVLGAVQLHCQPGRTGHRRRARGGSPGCRHRHRGRHRRRRGPGARVRRPGPGRAYSGRLHHRCVRRHQGRRHGPMQRPLGCLQGDRERLPVSGRVHHPRCRFDVRLGARCRREAQGRGR